MPRTAPAVDGTPLFKLLSVRWMDVSGDKSSDSYQFNVAATNAQIEAFVAALAAASNAVLYSAIVSDAYEATPDADDATNAIKDTVFDKVVILAKDNLRNSDNIFIPAPIAAVLADSGSGNLDQIDPASTELAAVLTAFLAVKNAGGGGYGIVSGRFTERKETNRAVPI